MLQTKYNVKIADTNSVPPPWSHPSTKYVKQSTPLNSTLVKLGPLVNRVTCPRTEP